MFFRDSLPGPLNNTAFLKENDSFPQLNPFNNGSEPISWQGNTVTGQTIK